MAIYRGTLDHQPPAYVAAFIAGLRNEHGLDVDDVEGGAE